MEEEQESVTGVLRQVLLSRSAGVNYPINTAVAFAVAIMVGLVILVIILPLIQAQEGNTGCVGPYRGIGSVIADMTGVSIC